MTKKTPGDPHKLVAEHMEASRKRDEWAKKGLKYSEAGKIAKAREALRKAEYWDSKRRELEPKRAR